MSRVVVLSLHTSPLEQPGRGDGGGMNVYVRELSSALARAGSTVEVFTRADDPEKLESVEVEPGFVLHHVAAGPVAAVQKAALPAFVDEFADGVAKTVATYDELPEAIHANYWLSGVAGQSLKRTFGVPLVSTFHTLDRVKAETSPEEYDPRDPDRRSRAEAEVIGCSDVVLASCQPEVDQLVELYGAERDRVEIVPPGVDHAFFAPGDRAQARRAISQSTNAPLLLFVGRIQPLKGADIAVGTIHELIRNGFADARLLIVGGPSGAHGEQEEETLRALVEDLAIADHVTFLPPQRHELLSTFYRAADVCLVPSRSESFGLVALEAAACGTPVVVSAVGGLTSLVDHGRNGYLVEGRDVDTYARHVLDLLRDRSLASRVGDAAATGAKRYTWSDAARRLRALYSDLAGALDRGLPVSDLLVVGGGRMGSALVGGLITAMAYRADEITVVDPEPKALEALRATYGVATSPTPIATGDAILAVKPGELERACGQLRSAGVARVLSIVAGATTTAIEGFLDPGTKVIRSMPNTPALIGAGASAIAGGSLAVETDLAWAESVLAAVGVVVRVPEKALDAVTGLSGSGPAYVFLVAEAMIEAGVLAGLDRATATTLATETLRGSAELLARSGESAGVLRAQVTSPGGTTAAGLRVLELRGVRAAILDAVAAATERSRELGGTN